MKAGTVVLGTVAAIGAGVVLGMLFAPDKGARTRKKLSDQSIRYADSVRSTANEYAESIEKGIEEARETVGVIAETFKTNKSPNRSSQGTP